jgi:hypothetical protein
MNVKLEPLLLTLEKGCTELAKATKSLAARVEAHKLADAEADERMAALKQRAQARDRSRFPSDPSRGRR